MPHVERPHRGTARRCTASCARPRVISMSLGFTLTLAKWSRRCTAVPLWRLFAPMQAAPPCCFRTRRVLLAYSSRTNDAPGPISGRRGVVRPGSPSLRAGVWRYGQATLNSRAAVSWAYAQAESAAFARYADRCNDPVTQWPGQKVRRWRGSPPALAGSRARSMDQAHRVAGPLLLGRSRRRTWNQPLHRQLAPRHQRHG